MRRYPTVAATESHTAANFPLLIARLAVGLSLALATCGCSDEPEKSDAADATSDSGAANSCGTKTSCTDDKGKADLALCPNATEYTCAAGCCEKIELCKADADCASKAGTELCPDDRYLCTCGSEGECQQSVCAVDADCPTGKTCNNGGCHDAPTGDLTTALLRPYWLARPGDSVDAALGLGAQARDKDGAAAVDAKFTWKLEGKGFKVDGGKLTATDEAGAATITATVVGGKTASNVAKLWNLGPLGKAKLRVAVANETTFAPVNGKVVAVGLADQSTPAAAQTVELKDGVATFENVEFPVDVHVIAAGHDAISALAITAKDGAADIVLPVRAYHHADLMYDGTGKMLKESKLVGGDVLTGNVNYSGEGEAGLGITSLGVSGDLLSFNIDALVGPSVKRPFHDDAPSLVNPEPGKPQDIPGGVTFLLSVPVVEGFVLAAPPGNRILWSLAGRVPLSDLGPAISSIVGAVDGGLDVGKVVSALLPYLSSFYSQIVMDVQFGDKLSSPGKTQDLAPTVPLALTTTIEPSALPKAGEGKWADLILSVAGAMMPDGQFVPLGLTAGPDALDGAKPDGIVDGDPEADGDQPMKLNYAPLHSGLRAGKVPNFTIVHAAINVGGGDKPEGGSIIISPIGPIAATVKSGDFLDYSMASKWDAEKREITIAAVKGAHLYRVILTGSESRRWVVVVPAEAAGKVLKVADLMKWGASVDLGKQPKRVFVGAFELHEAMTTPALLAPGGIDDLVRKVKRTSFIDIR